MDESYVADWLIKADFKEKGINSFVGKTCLHIVYFMGMEKDTAVIY